MCLMLVIAAGAFAQSAPSAGLTDSDVTSFSKNYGSIKAELEKLGIDVQDTDSVADAKSAEAKVNSILNKNGISGSNPVAKLKAIAFGYAVEKFEATMAGDPQASKMLQSMGIDPIADVRKEVAPADCKVVKKHLNELQKAFDDDDFPATSSSDQSSSTDSYDMAALQQYQNMLSASDYEDSDTKARKEVLKKYVIDKEMNGEGKKEYYDAGIYIRDVKNMVDFQNGEHESTENAEYVASRNSKTNKNQILKY